MWFLWMRALRHWQASISWLKRLECSAKYVSVQLICELSKN